MLDARALFGHSAVGFASLRFSPGETLPESERLPSSLARAVPKRRTEFLAGRRAARRAIESIAPEWSEHEIGRGERGEPLWPPGVVGAITHTHGFAAAACARRRSIRSIGLDSEMRIVPTAVREVAASICRSPELAHLELDPNRAERLTLVFSIKESLFKCLFPFVRRYFDFQDAEVCELDRGSGRFSVRLVTSLTEEFQAGWTAAAADCWTTNWSTRPWCCQPVLTATRYFQGQ